MKFDSCKDETPVQKELCQKHAILSFLMETYSWIWQVQTLLLEFDLCGY